MELKSLTQRSKCVGAESGCLSMLRECLIYCSMRLGVTFIAPRQLGAVGDQLGRQFLPSVEWCTGQSGAPPDSHCSCPVCDLLPYRAHRSLLLGAGWCTGHCPVHTGQFGVPNRPLMWATRRPWIVQLTVGRERLWLTGQPTVGYGTRSCEQNNHKKQNTRHVIFIPWFGQVTLAYFRVVASQWTRVALNPFQVTQ
jgi:hypothetical protein